MGYLTAHAEAQGFAQQLGLAHNKADLIAPSKGGRTLKLPSEHGVPEKGQAPKVHNNIKLCNKSKSLYFSLTKHL